MAKFGKVEGRITVPTGGWDVSLTDASGGPTTATIAAGTYYISSAGSGANDLPAAFAAAANAAMTQTWTCTTAAGENGTGKTTITATGGTLTISWTDTDLRDVLGFDGTEAASGGGGTMTIVSNDQARSLWLPNSGYQSLDGYDGSTWQGHWETDLHHLESAAGDVWSVMGSKKRILEILWPQVSKAKTWIAEEDTTNESFEKLFLDAICGEAAWGTAGGPLRIYYDAADDASYYTYRYAGPPEFRPSQVREHWTGAWSVSLPRLVQDPSEY